LFFYLLLFFFNRFKNYILVALDRLFAKISQKKVYTAPTINVMLIEITYVIGTSPILKAGSSPWGNSLNDDDYTDDLR